MRGAQPKKKAATTSTRTPKARSSSSQDATSKQAALSRNLAGNLLSPGGPLLLALDLIDEDPLQPRTKDNPGFSNARLGELAASIRLRGVKTPISVRDNPTVRGRFLINHGARRFRGSKLAGKVTIPAFIDNDYNEADQVVENLQRNELTAREIADYIGRELAKGMKKAAIAMAISKSPAFVTQHAALLDLPDAIAVAFNTGRVKDVTLVNELVTVYKRQPQEIDYWLANERQEITRGTVKLLREFLDEKRRQEQQNDSSTWSYDDAQPGYGLPVVIKPATKTLDKRIEKLAVHVRHHQRSGTLLLDRQPSVDGFAWVKYEDDGLACEVNLIDVQLVAVRSK